MPPAIVDAMQQFKAQLLASERRQMQEMASRWKMVERALESEVELLARVLADDMKEGRLTYLENLRSRSRFQNLLLQTQREINRYTDTYAEPLITAQQRTMAQLGIDHSTTAIQTAYSEAGQVSAVFDQLPIEAVEHMVGATGSGSPLRTLLREAYPTSASGMTDLLIRNTALGRNPRETAREAIRQGLAQGLNRILTIARSEQLRVYKTASLQNYRNSGVVKSWKRLATKDSRSCAGCIAADGWEYSLETDFQSHPQCRCTLLPVLKGLPTPTWETAPQWFASQPEATQRSILGPSRYNLWRDGMDFSKFATMHHDNTWGDSIVPTLVRDLV